MKNFGVKIFNDKKKLKKLISLAKSGRYSSPQIAKFLNCSRSTVLGTLNKLDIHLQNLGTFKKKFSCDDKFFDKLSPISVYWVGFIAADGVLAERDKCVAIGLQRQDATHLRKFIKAMKSNSKILYIKSNNSAHVRIYSHILFNSLAKLGLSPNKALRIQEVKIPLKLMSHFIRGVYDGDGSIWEIKLHTSNFK